MRNVVISGSCVQHLIQSSELIGLELGLSISLLLKCILSHQERVNVANTVNFLCSKLLQIHNSSIFLRSGLKKREGENKPPIFSTYSKTLLMLFTKTTVY